MGELKLPAWAIFPPSADSWSPGLSQMAVWIYCFQPLWMAGLRRFLPAEIPLRQASSVSELSAALGSAGPLFLVYEWQRAAPEEFTGLASDAAKRPWPTGVAVVGRGISFSEKIAICSVGLCHGVYTPREMCQLARTIVRFFRVTPWWSWPDRAFSPVQFPW